MIKGVGIDIASISRMEAGIRRYGERFVQRIFTEAEQAYCRNKANQFQHYAARFDGKEAFLKAAGVGLRDGIRWHDMEFINDPLGKPVARYRGRLSELLHDRQVEQVHVSFSHTADNAVAVVILE